MSADKNSVADAMLTLEKALREAELWADHSPSSEQMLSDQPFSYDVMTLQEWLQWVFIPRMKAIIESDAELPRMSNIHAYAEETIGKLPNNTEAVMQALKQLDELFSV